MPIMHFLVSVNFVIRRCVFPTVPARLQTFKSSFVFGEGCVIHGVLWDDFLVTWQVSLHSARKLFKQVILSWGGLWSDYRVPLGAFQS